jgi:hypothetical protein
LYAPGTKAAYRLSVGLPIDRINTVVVPLVALLEISHIWWHRECFPNRTLEFRRYHFAFYVKLGTIVRQARNKWAIGVMQKLIIACFLVGINLHLGF